MAKINSNMLVKGARGHVGKQFVYKKRGESTFITRMPEAKAKARVSASQEVARDRFASAAKYATGVINDPVLKKEYQKKTSSSNTAYNIAFRDYLKAPVVKAIRADAYNGTVGSVISVEAKDDFRVAAVKVRILAANGSVLEQGNATLNPIDRNLWNYSSTAANAQIAGTKIEATAFDLPGNQATLSIVL